MAESADRPITIAILALGGQGGGVLTRWLVDVAEENGYLAQSTYVAGLAQRTGATIYCVEMIEKERAHAAGRDPVFALYPVSGDVDVVVASELAETGRAIQKGFVTPNLTTLVASSHRVYAIEEKMALGDGILDQQPVIEAARQAARRFVCFDMNAAAIETKSVISAVLLGAIAGTGALPFARHAFEMTIRRQSRAVESNLAGFAAGFTGAQQESDAASAPTQPQALPTIQGANGQALAQRIRTTLPARCQPVALHAATRALDYQDRGYADLYLDRLQALHAWDVAAGGAARDFELTATAAAPLALQMCYEDTIRVADLKTRSDRLPRIQREAAAKADQPTYVIEYFHPRYEEICDTLPAALGARLIRSKRVKRWLAPVLRKGRNFDTTRIGGFLMLYLLAGLRRFRRRTYRYRIQQQRIQSWLDLLQREAGRDYRYAVAVADCIRIIKGYGATYERGLSRFDRTLAATGKLSGANRADTLLRLQTAAQADEQGLAFERVLEKLQVTADASI